MNNLNAEGIVPAGAMVIPPKIRKKKFSFFIGIDVSKNKLDFALLADNQFVTHRVIKNNPDEIGAFIDELKSVDGFKMSKAVFTMEQTGFYCNHLLDCLQKLKACVTVENPMQIKKTLGVTRGKNDKVDSQRIAQFAFRYRDELKLWVPKRPVILQLINLFAIRNRLLGVSVALKLPLAEELKFIRKGIQRQNSRSCRKSIGAINADLKDIDAKIDQLVNNDQYLNWLMDIVISVPGIGPITAIQMIICTNEFKDISDPKKFACYAGVAPFKSESGEFTSKSKVSPIANKKMKSLLHLCAMGSIRYDKEMRAYYERKTAAEGKNGMVVLNAIRYKLIQRVFACVRQRRHFIIAYKRDGVIAGELADA